MKRSLILLLYLAMVTTPVQCATSFLPPLKAIDSNPLKSYSNTEGDYSNALVQNPIQSTTINQNYQNLGKIETSLFGRIFANQTLTARLSRIEKSLFTTTYPNASDSQRIDNIISNFNQINKYPNISKNVLTKLENKVLNQCFQQNSPERRIERLEQQVFGAEQSGDLDTRYNSLQSAVKNYNATETADSTGFYNSTPKSGLRGLAGLLGGSFMGGSMMGGSMTGFTPPISPLYDNFSNGMNNYNNGLNNNYSANNYGGSYPPSGSGIYKGYRTNTGYHDSYSDFGSRTGVTILD